MNRFFKNVKGAVVALMPIIVLPVVYFAYLGITAIEDTYKNSTNSISMEYENKTVTPPEKKKNTNDDIPIIKYKGFDTFGEIRIPSINLNMKVISNITSDAIEVASSYLYSTNGFNRPGNTVIIGHNYRNGKLFSNVTKLKVGDKIYLKTNGQKEIEYTIYKTFVTSSSDASFYNRQTNGKREISLSTCTDDADVTDNRLIILAKEN